MLQTLLVLFLIAGIASPPAFAMSDEAGEYEIKAGFLYKFLLFADWPEDVLTRGDGRIKLCILGDRPSRQTFAPVNEEMVKGRELDILWFHAVPDADSLSQCQLLFIGASQGENAGDIIKSVKDEPVLTVGETEGFVERGGMINFIVRDDFVAFEINQKATEDAGIKIRAQLLRVAYRIVNGNHD